MKFSNRGRYLECGEYIIARTEHGEHVAYTLTWRKEILGVERKVPANSQDLRREAVDRLDAIAEAHKSTAGAEKATPP